MAWIQFWNYNENSDITIINVFILFFLNPTHLIQLYWHYRARIPDSQRHVTEMECGPLLLTLLCGDSLCQRKAEFSCPSCNKFMFHIYFVLKWVRFDLARPLPLMASSASRWWWSHVSILGLADKATLLWKHSALCPSIRRFLSAAKLIYLCLSTLWSTRKVCKVMFSSLLFQRAD